jgi:hypothetical protein
MKNLKIVRNYFVLPCCFLLLNLCVEFVSYKARSFRDPLLRTGVIMAMVLFGGTLVSFLVAPAIGTVVGSLHRGSRQSGGTLGGLVFLTLLALVIFWLYYRVYILGVESVLPSSWHNSKLPH